MPDYSLGKVYKIVNSENDKVYIGSSAMKYLCERMGGHRKTARGHGKYRSSRLYKAMRKIGIDKFKIELIKEFPCASKKELEKEEFRIIQKVIKRGVSLYNTLTEYGIVPVGKESTSFKRGNVCFDKANSNWQFQWYPVPGRKKNKSFSVNKYGYDEAKAMAIALQDITYPKIS